MAAFCHSMQVHARHQHISELLRWSDSSQFLHFAGADRNGASRRLLGAGGPPSVCGLGMCVSFLCASGMLPVFRPFKFQGALAITLQ